MSTGEIAARGLIDLVVIAHEEGWVDKLKNLLKKRHKILVLGPTGTGKTQLIRSLSNIVPEAISIMERTQFIERSRMQISDKLFEFIEAPGDEFKEEHREKAYRESVKDGISAVINVASFGYHEYRTEESEVFSKNKQVKKKFLESHRNIEIEMLEEWDWQLLNPDVTNSLITVVTKADIWWENELKVLKHYKSGDYAKALNGVATNHAVIPYCARKHQFYGKGKLSSSFDDDDLDTQRSVLFQTLLSAVGRVNND